MSITPTTSPTTSPKSSSSETTEQGQSPKRLKIVVPSILPHSLPPLMPPPLEPIPPSLFNRVQSPPPLLPPPLEPISPPLSNRVQPIALSLRDPQASSSSSSSQPMPSMNFPFTVVDIEDLITDCRTNDTVHNFQTRLENQVKFYLGHFYLLDQLNQIIDTYKQNNNIQPIIDALSNLKTILPSIPMPPQPRPEQKTQGQLLLDAYRADESDPVVKPEPQSMPQSQPMPQQPQQRQKTAVDKLTDALTTTFDFQYNPRSADSARKAMTLYLVFKQDFSVLSGDHTHPFLNQFKTAYAIANQKVNRNSTGVQAFEILMFLKNRINRDKIKGFFMSFGMFEPDRKKIQALWAALQKVWGEETTNFESL